MAGRPTLLYLHGVGDGDQTDTWRSVLDSTLLRIGYPGLADVEVVAPKYSHGLRGVDDDYEIPPVTVRAPRGHAAAKHRRDFERRRTAMELLLGKDDEGRGFPGAGQIAAFAKDALRRFEQARNYSTETRNRGYVLQRALEQVGVPERLVIVGHSLGSVIAADLLCRLPSQTQVVGMVTIGSPLAHEAFDVDGFLELLEDPPMNLAWWVNFRNSGDLITGLRGISARVPWVLDQRIGGANPKGAHEASGYLSDERVAHAIARGVFGSTSRELVPVSKRTDLPLDLPEVMALLGLRFAYLTLHQLDGEVGARYADAVRQTQAVLVDSLTARNATDGRPTPSVIADLAVDLSDVDSLPSEPEAPTELSIAEAVVPLVAIVMTNVLQPFEIEVSKVKRQKAMRQLTVEMGLGEKVGTNVVDAVDEARGALDGPTNWWRWAAVGLGMVAVAVATGGLIFAAAPGLAGAAAITSALAAFGPGGMLGGLLTVGALVTAGGGGIAIGLAGTGTSAATVEAVVTAQLATAILRDKQGLAQDPQTWANLTDLEVEIARNLARLKPVSDGSASAVKELERKLDTIRRAVDYLRDHGLAPVPRALSIPVP